MKASSLRILPCLAALLIASCTAAPVPSPDTPEANTEHPRRSAIVPGVVSVKVSEELAEQLASGALPTRSGAVNSAFDRLGVIKIEREFPDGGEWEPRHREAGLHRWFRIEFDPEAVPATKAAQDLSSIPGILAAEPERRICKVSYFNDPRAANQWALYNHGFPESKYTEGCDVNVVPVWDRYTAGSNEVIVAVLDEGIQLNHQDLAGVCIPAGANGSQSFIYGRTGSNIPVGDHGTHVAGIIGAINNNNIGISSIAGGYDSKGGVRLLSLAVLMDDPEDPDKTIGGYTNNAFIWAADHGALIANNSWGYVYDTEAEAMADGIDEKLEIAINYFIKYAGCDVNGNQKPDSPMKGGLVVFAAGNSNWRIGWPAAYEPVLAVGALSSNLKRAHYSNYGSWVDICAPGGDFDIGPGIVSTISNNDYDVYQGTSMACPMVSGVAALLVSHYGGPGFTVKELKDRLLKGADKYKAPGDIGPVLNALGSFSYGGKEAPDAPKGLSAKVSANTVTLSWDVAPDKDDVKAYGYIMYISKDRAAISRQKPGNLTADGVIAREVEGGFAKIGETISAQFTDLEFVTEYYAAVVAYDYAGHYSPLSDIIKLATTENNQPEIVPEVPGNYVLKAFQNPIYHFDVNDPDGHKVTIRLDEGSSACRGSVMATYIDVTITGVAAPAGVYNATITATDRYGAASSYSFSYEILPNHTPTLIKNASDVIFEGSGDSIELNIPEYIYDEDEEPLTYKLSSSDEGVASVSASGNTVKVVANGYGVSTIDINASDVSRTSCDLQFKVLVRDPSLQVEIFPNPVKTKLFIRPMESGTLQAGVSNKAGAEVFSGTAEVTPFEPMGIDLSACASGTYYVRLKGCGLNGTYTIVKI